MVNLEVSDLQGRNVKSFLESEAPVTVDDIPVQSNVERRLYLKDINLPCIDADIQFFIGSYRQ